MLCSWPNISTHMLLFFKVSPQKEKSNKSTSDFQLNQTQRGVQFTTSHHILRRGNLEKH